MDHDRTQRSPRLILDESINFSSLKILLPCGLIQRCSGVYQSWHAEKTRDDQLMEQRESNALADGRRQQEAALVRIKNGVMRWLAGQAVAQYPCVYGSYIYAKIDPSPQVLNRGSGPREYPGFLRTRNHDGRPS